MEGVYREGSHSYNTVKINTVGNQFAANSENYATWGVTAWEYGNFNLSDKDSPGVKDPIIVVSRGR